MVRDEDKVFSIFIKLGQVGQRRARSKGKPGICPERQKIRGGKIDLFLTFKLAISHSPPKLVVKVRSSYIDKISLRQGKIARGKRDPSAAVSRNKLMMMKVEREEAESVKRIENQGGEEDKNLR
ncbi:hypothetical protein EVAR_59990_1 [Eumeta japonica]|uniref:Uncharacterized protein n=1 Tax=Eumeta variegata TaxID=151549 RepID=A0A4C1ZG50_EUMVA|nr:hypothetical protein EVAR_59990_1 [Eumeta japonica]